MTSLTFIKVTAFVIICLAAFGISTWLHDYVGEEEFKCPGCSNISGRIDNCGYTGVKSFKVECHACGLSGDYESFTSLVKSWPLTEKTDQPFKE